MLKKILLALAAFVVVFLVVVAFQPSEFRVARSVTVEAPPETIFPHLNDLKKAHVWSPWVKMDPAANYDFAGPAEGVGASTSWAGEKVGEGRQTITESRPGELVRSKLEFIKPFESTSDTDFTLTREGQGTVVTWSIWGENNFLGKAMCLIMSQDKMIGEPFEQGLAELKRLVESSPRT